MGMKDAQIMEKLSGKYVEIRYKNGNTIAGTVCGFTSSIHDDPQRGIVGIQLSEVSVPMTLDVDEIVVKGKKI